MIHDGFSDTNGHINELDHQNANSISVFRQKHRKRPNELGLACLSPIHRKRLVDPKKPSANDRFASRILLTCNRLEQESDSLQPAQNRTETHSHSSRLMLEFPPHCAIMTLVDQVATHVTTFPITAMHFNEDCSPLKEKVCSDESYNQMP